MQFIKQMMRSVVFITRAPQYKNSTPGKILDNWQIPVNAQIQLNNALIGAHSCKMFADLLKDNFMYMNDYSIAFAMKRIYDLDLELDEHFHQTMVPLLRDYVSRMTREHNRTLGEIVTFCGYLDVQDEQLWGVFEQKLLDERLYRCMCPSIIQWDFSMDYLRVLLDPKTCLEQLRVLSLDIGLFILGGFKIRLALSQEQRNMCLEAFQDKKYSSPMLYKVLENPNFDVEAELRNQQKKISA